MPKGDGIGGAGEFGGQGFQLEFTSQANTAVAIWFTFAPDGSGQKWIFAQGNYDNTKNTEFVELWNPSATPQDVSGWRLDGAVQYAFPASTVMAPNSYKVIAASSTAL